MELSNEIWGGFPQGAWADTQPGGRYQWQNRRTKEILAIAREILGARVIGVLGSQAANLGVSQAACAGGTEGIECLAIAPYLSHLTPPFPTTDIAILAMVKNYELNNCRQWITQQKAFAASRGMRLVCYEGGIDFYPVAGTPLQATYDRVAASEEMAQIYKDHMAFWEAEVNDVYLWYTDIHNVCFSHWPSEMAAPFPRGRVIQERIAAAAVT
jgi:hypothetical protein